MPASDATPSTREGLSPLGSRSIAAHLSRGLAGFVLLAVALGYAPRLGWWTLVPAAGALAMFRGCPMCWVAGLVDTVLHRMSRNSDAASKTCVNGSCTVK